MDDQGRSSQADRVFTVNRTLARLRLSAGGLLRLGRTGSAGMTARFELARPARVTATVATAPGATVAVLARRNLAAGQHSLVWNGRSGKALARTARYELRIAAVNAVGRAELSAPFTVRR